MFIDSRDREVIVHEYSISDLSEKELQALMHAVKHTLSYCDRGDYYYDTLTSIDSKMSSFEQEEF